MENVQSTDTKTSVANAAIRVNELKSNLAFQQKKQSELRQNALKNRQNLELLEQKTNYLNEEKKYAEEHGETIDGKSVQEVENELNKIKTQSEAEKQIVLEQIEQLKQVRVAIEPMKSEINKIEEKFENNKFFAVYYDQIRRSNYLEEAARLSEIVVDSKAKTDSVEQLNLKLNTEKDFNDVYTRKIETARDYKLTLRGLLIVDPEAKKIYEEITRLNAKKRKQGNILSQEDKEKYKSKVTEFSYLVIGDKESIKAQTQEQTNEQVNNEKQVEKPRGIKRIFASIKKLFTKSSTKRLAPGIETKAQGKASPTVISARQLYVQALENQKNATKQFDEYTKQHELPKAIKTGIEIVEKEGNKDILGTIGKIDMSDIIKPILASENKVYTDNKKMAKIYGNAATIIEKKYTDRGEDLSALARKKYTIEEKTNSTKNTKDDEIEKAV